MMKLRIAHIMILIVASAALAGCSRKSFPEEPEQPQALFKVQGTIDGNPIAFSAGQDGYYLYTNYEHFPGDQWQYTADMTQTDCSVCGPSLRCILYGTGNGPGLPDINEVLQPGAYDFAINGQIGHEFDFSGIANGAFDNYIAVDGYELQGEQHYYTTNNAFLNIAFLVVNEPFFCPTTIGLDMQTLNCEDEHHTISAFRMKVENDEVEVYAPQHLLEMGVPVAWYGDNFSEPLLITDGPGPYEFNIPAMGAITAIPAGESLDSPSYVCERVIAATGDEYTCEEFDFEIRSSVVDADQQFTLLYTDENGEVYTTSGSCGTFFTQPIESWIEVSNIEDFSTNENGDPTRKFTLTGDCLLQNLYNPLDIVQLIGLSAEIAVAYPE